MKTWTLITGASTGIGREFAQIAANEGRNLILTARNESKLKQVADALRKTAGDVVILPADLSKFHNVERLWEEAISGRQIDTLINNAGLGSQCAFEHWQSWNREFASINVNVLALTYLMKRAIPHMKSHGAGRIMNVASVASFTPATDMAVYHAGKAFVLYLSEGVAEELRGSGVTVTAHCPGPTATPFFEAAGMSNVPLSSIVRPMSARRAARIGWQAMSKGRRVVVPGLIYKVLAFLPRVSPRRMATALSGKLMSGWS